MNTREQNLTEIECHWCERMTSLVEQNQIQDADALFSEYVVDDVDPFELEWLFITCSEDVC